MFSDFSQIFSLGTSKVFSICPEEFWGVFLGERVLLQHLWTLSKKMKHFGKSFIGKVVKLSFTCPKQQFIRICRWKKKQNFPRSQTRSNGNFGRFNRIFQQDCQTCSLSDRWNSLWEEVQLFICHDFETLGR